MSLKSKFNNYVQTLETYIMFQIKQKQLELTEELTKKGRKPIALSMGAPVDMVPQYAVDTLKSILDDPSIHTYSTPKGETYLLEAISRRMKKRFDVDLNPKTEIFSLIGSKEGIANMIRDLINPTTDEFEKDIIMCPNPGYASYTQMLKASGGLCWGIKMTPENNYMPNLEDELKELLSKGYKKEKIKAVIINYPNNPLGATCTLEYMQKCVDFCKKHDIILISDNAYCDLYFDENDKPHSVLECNGAKDIAIEFYSFSKPYAMTGWRMGWAAGNEELVSMLGKLKSTIDTGIFKALQLTGAKLLDSKEGDDYIENANKKFKNKIQKFVNGLNSLGYDVKMPKAAFYLWIKIPERYNGDSKKYAEDLLEKSGIVLVPGEAFGDLGKGYVRISVTNSEKNLDEVIERMKLDGFQY